MSDSRTDMPRHTGRRRAARAPRPRSLDRQSGFTLLEVMLATVIVGTAVLAIVAAQQAYHHENMVSQRMGTALLLANEVREMTLNLPMRDPITGKGKWGPESNEPTVAQYDDLDDFDGTGGAGVVFSPPVDASRNDIPNMAGWSQAVTVENVLPSFVNGTAAPSHSTDVVRLTCRVLFQGPTDVEAVEITRLTWLRAGGP